MSNISWYRDYFEWERRCAEEIYEVILQPGRPKAIALSGGTTPRGVYMRLGRQLGRLPRRLIDGLKFFVVDERDVPLHASRSNSRMIIECLGDEMVVPFDSSQSTAESYTNKIESFLGVNGQFDLVVLGCGPDGHTASLFPNSELLDKNVNGFYANQLSSGERRFSLTFPSLLGARQILILVNNDKVKHEFFSSQTAPLGDFPIMKIRYETNAKVIIHDDV